MPDRESKEESYLLQRANHIMGIAAQERANQDPKTQARSFEDQLRITYGLRPLSRRQREARARRNYRGRFYSPEK